MSDNTQRNVLTLQYYATQYLKVHITFLRAQISGMSRLVDPLSPILTDQEMSPMHHEQNQQGKQSRRGQRNSRKPDDVERRDTSRDEPDYSQDPNRSEEEGRIVTDFLTSDDNLSSRSTSAPVSPSATSDDYHSDEHARADRRNDGRGDDALDDEDDLVSIAFENIKILTENDSVIPIY